MKEVRLISLKLKNFKGIKDFEILDFSKDTRVYGDNGAGKTTLFDAFSWLLFDKDSKGQSNFDIKTLDENNNVLHNLEHEVEGILGVDDKLLTLKKIYKEKWTRKRGSATEEFTGHTTDYYLNDVPVKKSEYDQRISEIVDEQAFKLLTNPSYFNEELHWKDRRDILLKVCGDIAVDDVIESNKDLADLKEILKDRSVEDHQKVISSKKSKINKELDKLPVRIDEVSKGLRDVSEIDEKAIKDEIAGLKMRKAAKEKQIANVESGGEVAKKRKQLNEIESELLEIRNSHSSKYQEKIEQAEDKLDNARDKYRELELKAKDKQLTLKINQTDVANYEEQMEELRQEYKEVRDKKLEIGLCPACGRELPEESIDKITKKFNLKKSNKLEEINDEGKSLKESVIALKSEIEKLENEIQGFEKMQDRWKVKAEELKAEIDKLKSQSKLYQDSKEYQAKLAEKEKLESEIESLQQDKSQATDKLREDIYVIEKQIDTNERKLSQLERYEHGQKRIKELSEQEKILAKEYSKLERELFLCEEFTKTKVELLEEKVESEFDYAQFKMFEEQINGGVKECCETLFKGVPYGSSLNNAARVNVGLDVINTLSEFYGFRAPIFVDNAESVTKLIKVDSQVIRLIVSEDDKKLRVEVE
ncbi:AAA domain-containing protein, putative AbiEii toxin, Type IV TA system [Orenia metallireducens]|uniref:Nuclease SbcCD subunit C n=1 Tax=Orenia metallireducens TaxID=1413210 RepID=A0A285G6N2_9FIRM|nr:AAA family ATPase [Orenia metallireducens]SNY19250.1 AAA domain-containing protein, putative AbiEii toxin, Type IV TA system [Orenia metallireducens]